MGIATLKPGSEIPNKAPVPIVVEKVPYLGIVSDNAEVPVESLVAYLEGMPWSVNYYSQLIGAHSDLREIDINQNASIQQYTEILDVELRVNASIQGTYDAAEGITTVQGSAIIVHIVPNDKDYFTAEAGKGERGVFKVDSVERRTFNRGAVYLINYSLVCYARPTEPIYNGIIDKVVKKLHFSKDRLVEGLSPVLQEEDYAISLNLGQAYLELIQRFFRIFFNRGMMTMFVPGQQTTVYDAWLVNFLVSIMDSQEVPEMKHMRMVSLDHDRYMEQGSLWKVLLERNYGELKRTHQKAILAPRTYFNRSSWMKGPIYWNIANYVYPLVEKDETAIVGLNRPPPVGIYVEMIGGEPMELPPLSLANVYDTGEGVIPLIKSVLIDDYYVLSEPFYTGGTNLSALEILTRDYLKCQTIDLKMLSSLVSAYPDWPVLERFYYGPLLILLLKESIKGFYI